MTRAERLSALGFTLAPLELNAGKIMRGVCTGNLVYTSGQVSSWADEQIFGQLGGDLSVEQGYRAAQLCTVGCLAVVQAVAGSLDAVTQVVKVLGMVNVAPGFTDTPSVIHGCSDMLLEVFGDTGRHARSAVGMTIPLNYAVEIEIIFEVAA